MTDRNTISQLIESLFEDWIDKNINVHPLAVENMRLLEADALALLKEQQPVEMDLCNGEPFCPTCGAIVRCYYNFCAECGQKFKKDLEGYPIFR